MGLLALGDKLFGVELVQVGMRIGTSECLSRR